MVGESPLTPYGPLAPRHLARLDGIEHVGDLALISRVDEGTEMVAAFEEPIGLSAASADGRRRQPVPGRLGRAGGPAARRPAVHRQLKAWLAAA